MRNFIKYLLYKTAFLQSYLLLIKKPNALTLDLGSGKRKGGPDEITLDDGLGADLFCDLRNGIPFGDDRFEIIYTSHLLEHLRFNDQLILLKEIYRVLKPKGKLLVCVPNIQPFLKFYSEGNNYLDFLKKKHNYKPMQSALNNTGSNIDSINYMAYLDTGHSHMFDLDSLLGTLKLCGFENVEEREPNFYLDKDNRKFESIYASGEKK